MDNEPDAAKDLFRDMRSYTDGIKAKLPDHLRAALDKWDGSGGTVTAKLPFAAEILWAARDVIGEGGRNLLRRIAWWGAFHEQQTLRHGRAEDIHLAMLRDLKAGRVVFSDRDPAIDVRLIAPPPIELPEIDDV